MKPENSRAQFFESFRKKDNTGWIDPEATLYSESSIS